MRILMLSSSLEPNHGYGTVSAHLCAHLARGLGATMDVFTGEKPGARELSRDSLKSMRFESHPSLGLLIAIHDVACVLLEKSEHYDVIHVMVEHFSVAGWILSRILRVPLVITTHGTYAVRLPMAYSAFKRAFAAADQVVADSRCTRKRMEAFRDLLPREVMQRSKWGWFAESYPPAKPMHVWCLFIFALWHKEYME